MGARHAPLHKANGLGQAVFLAKSNYVITTCCSLLIMFPLTVIHFSSRTLAINIAARPAYHVASHGSWLSRGLLRMCRDADMRHLVVWLAGLLVLVSASPLLADSEWPLWAGPPSLGPPALNEFPSGESCVPLYRRGGGLAFFAGYIDHAKGFNLSFDPTTTGYQPSVLLERWQH